MSKISAILAAFSLCLALFAASCKSDGAAAGQKLQGIYSYDLPNFGGNGVLKLQQVDDSNVKFNLSIVGGPPAHNQGMMEGTAKMNGNKIDITTEEFGGKCHIEVTLMGDSLSIKTLAGGPSECGFGNGIMADGLYKLTGRVVDEGSEAPSDTATVQTAPAVTNETPPTSLAGHWVSTIDPKAEVKIEGSQYIDVYEGKEVAKAPFTFYMQCGRNCGTDATAPGPCLKVGAAGEESMCYAVLRVDALTLEMSLIGGAGKTLAFKRKEQ